MVRTTDEYGDTVESVAVLSGCRIVSKGKGLIKLLDATQDSGSAEGRRRSMMIHEGTLAVFPNTSTFAVVGSQSPVMVSVEPMPARE